MSNIQPEGTFTAGLWESAAPLVSKIISCGFVAELSEGTLSHNCFAHYLSQDILYLRQDNEALETLSARSVEAPYREFFLKLANDGIEIEKKLHEEYLSHFKVEEAQEQSPAFGEYGRFILQQARLAPYPVAAATLLPCFWVYACTGEAISRKAGTGNKYQKFIDTYSGNEYESYVEQFIAVVETLGQKASPEVQDLMKQSFLKATAFEMAVFEEAFSSVKSRL